MKKTNVGIHGRKCIQRTLWYFDTIKEAYTEGDCK